jgi:Transposase, Mutator family
VRRAKDNRQVAKRYYRPEQTTCLHCGQVLRRCYPLWRKYIVFLSGRDLVVSMGYHCPNPQCAGHRRVSTSQAARRLTVRGSSFALEVIVQIGYWRFWQRWTVAQIHEVLTQERHLPISRRQVLNLIGVFLVLLRCTYHLRLARHAASFRRHGLFVALDALKPEKGNTALYVVRELKFGLVLHEVALLTTDHRTLAKGLLQPVKDLGYRLRGIVSDDEHALVVAVAKTFPGVPHQTCQIHCLREAARPIANADRSFKKALKKAIRGPFYTACRSLQEQLAAKEPRSEVLRTYAELIRSTLTEASKPPFALGGLRVFEDLRRLEASLTRSRQKGGTRSWINCWGWSHSANHLPPAINNSNASEGGWWNWTGVSTHQRLRVSRARPASRFSAK